MPATPNYLWKNGELVPWDQATVHASTLGWSTMGAVFEGIKAYWNPARAELYGLHFAEHFQRFVQSMRLMRMQLNFTAADFLPAAQELLRANDCREDTYVRPLAYHGDADWFGSLLDKRTDVIMWTAPFHSILGTGRAIRACVSSWTRLADNQMSPRIKAIANYQNSRMALIEAQLRGYDQPILLNPAGKVTEGPASCLFMVRNGVAITPHLTSGILESVTRDALLRLCREVLDLPVAERAIDRTELYIAEELFLCGTGGEVTPIREIDDYVVGNGQVGPLTARIEAAYHAVVRGDAPEFAEWRTPIWAPAAVGV